MTFKSPKFERFIERDKQALKIYLGFSLFIVTIGIILIIISFLPLNGLDPKSYGFILKIGGGFLSSLSGFPLKEYLSRKDRIHGLIAIRDTWLELSNSPDTSEEDITRLMEIVWKLYEKGATG